MHERERWQVIKAMLQESGLVRVADVCRATAASEAFVPEFLATVTSVGPLTAGPLACGRALIATGAAVPATAGASGVTGTGGMATGFGGLETATSLDPSRALIMVSQPFAARPGNTGLQALPALMLVTENTRL